MSYKLFSTKSKNQRSHYSIPNWGSSSKLLTAVLLQEMSVSWITERYFHRISFPSFSSFMDSQFLPGAQFPARYHLMTLGVFSTLLIKTISIPYTVIYYVQYKIWGDKVCIVKESMNQVVFAAVADQFYLKT